MIGSGPASLEVTFSGIKGARIYGKPFRTPNVSAEDEDPLIAAKGYGLLMMLPKNANQGRIEVKIEGKKTFLDRRFDITLLSSEGFRAGQIVPCVIPPQMVPLSEKQLHEVRAAGGLAQITYDESVGTEGLNWGGVCYSVSGHVRVTSVNSKHITFTLENVRFGVLFGAVRGNFIVNGHGEATITQESIFGRADQSSLRRMG